MSAQSAINSWVSFGRQLTKVDHSKINRSIAVRNALGVAIPLAVGIALHNPVGAAAVATGALNVSYSDGRDPYRHRAERMLLWTFLGAIAVFIGSLTGAHSVLAVLVTAVWAFVGGLGVAVSSRTGDLGLNTTVALIVFGARAAFDLEGAAITAALVLAGGLLQATFSLLFWPLRGSNPEGVALGQVYEQLASELRTMHAKNASEHAGEALLEQQAGAIPAALQETLDALGSDHSVEGERFRMLLDQVDRIRLSAFGLRRAGELVDDKPQLKRGVDEVLLASANLAQAVSACVTPGKSSADLQVQVENLNREVDELNRLANSGDSAAVECAAAADVLAGQVRTVVTLVNLTSSGEAGELQRAAERTWGWRLQVGNWLNTLRANLNWGSGYFRHALRLAVCVAIGDAIGRSISWQRSYWIPMTIAVVLRPDFATTFSRGFLRLIGTFAGLVIATGLYHLLPTKSHEELAISQLLLVGAFTFALRSIGPANYGVFSASIAGLVVFLIAATGTAPKDVVVQRALNTLAGGVFAMIAYAVWPTWERKHVNDILAKYVESLREYLHETAARCGRPERIREFELDQFRNQLRRARSDAEASVDRVKSEPGAQVRRSVTLVSILASAHSLAHCILGLEASLLQGSAICGDVFRRFTNDLEFTLHSLSGALGGAALDERNLPGLRRDYRKLLEASAQLRRDDLVLSEADRMTVATNTLREQVLKLVRMAG